MTDSFKAAMLEAARLTRAGRIADAASLIQQTLGGAIHSVDLREGGREGRAESEIIEGECAVVDDRTGVPDTESSAGGAARNRASEETERGEGDRFIAGSYGNAAGRRQYKLFIPVQASSRPETIGRGLIVMLHGCNQTADDFAVGTRMNQLAGALGYCVLYPMQVAAANGSGCWNWFEERDQLRDCGEPSIISGMTRQIVQSLSVDPGCVYVAGLSAGGAMAATMAILYPDLYAAVGIHSGLPYGAARDLVSALKAMRQGASGVVPPRVRQEAPPVPAIVFHGDADAIVHPANAFQVVAQLCSGTSAPVTELHVEQRHVNRGPAYSRRLFSDQEDRLRAELWLVQGAGHGWLGGNPSGSFTVPRGPDASCEMLRFFAEHIRSGS